MLEVGRGQEQNQVMSDDGTIREGTGLKSLDFNERKDIGLVNKAVRERWPVLPSDRQLAVDTIREKLSSPMNLLNADAYIRCLVSMEGQNQADEHHEADKEAHKQALADGTAQVELLSRLRITIKGKANAELPAKAVPAQDVTGSQAGGSCLPAAGEAG